MPPTDKKLEKLQKLLEVANEDFATPDDLIALSEGLLNVITTEKQRLDKVIADNKDDDTNEKAELLDILNEKERGLKYIVEKLRRDTATDITTATTRLATDIKRIERKIPTKTDLSGLEREIADIKDSFNSFPTELTMNNEAIRDGLELLQGDERLGKSAIKGLDDYDEIVALARSPKTIGNAGVKLLRYLSDVNIEGITNGQTITWNSTLNRFEPGSGGSGSAHTIQDEGTPLTQRTKLNFVGAGVTVTDDAGSDATVVTIPSSAPGSGIVRSIASIAVNTAAGSAAGTDYDYNCTAALTLTLPTAIGNTNQYSVTRISGLTTIATTAAQTINGSATATITINNMTLTLISDGANWNIK